MALGLCRNTGKMPIIQCSVGALSTLWTLCDVLCMLCNMLCTLCCALAWAQAPAPVHHILSLVQRLANQYSSTVTSPLDPPSTQVTPERGFAFIEFADMMDATCALVRCASAYGQIMHIHAQAGGPGGGQGRICAISSREHARLIRPGKSSWPQRTRRC